MSGLELRAVRMVNWHNFTDETIALDGSLFLVGDNGAGKTTVLDAVHLALTGALGVELNAAARVRGRRGEGRDLAGILLRHDLERGHRRPEGAVGYCLLELSDAQRKSVLTIGLGAFAAGPDSRPDRWGIIAPLPLSEIELVEQTAEGRRVRDRAELAEHLPAGSLMDLGRYRTRVGERLFGSRASFEQVSHFLAAGKAYRDLVAATENFGGLFASLLPDPDEGAFHEIRRALEAMERTRTDLSALDQELGQLRTLLGLIDEIEGQKEVLCRYAYLGSHHEAARAEHEETEARAAIEVRRAARGELEERLHALRIDLEAAESESGRLRASEGIALLERRRELSAAREREAVTLGEAIREQETASRVLGQVAGEAERTTTRVAELAGAGTRILEGVGASSAPHLGPVGLDALGRLQDQLRGLHRLPDRPLPEELERLQQKVLHALLRGASEAAARAAGLRETERDARAHARQARAEAEALRARGEPPPPLAGVDLEGALAALAAEGIAASPLYRCLEPGPGVSLERTGYLERALGPRLLSALVVAPEHHDAALGLLLARWPGLPLARAPRTGKTPRAAPGGTSLVDELHIEAAGGAEAVATSFLAYHLAPIAPEDADAVVAEEPERSFLTGEGHLRHARADERLLPGPPRWLGTAARARALAEAIDHLEAEAEANEDRADAASTAAAGEDAIEETLGKAADALEGLSLQALALAAQEREHARVRAAELEERVSATTRRSEGHRARLAATDEVLATLERAIQEEGLDVLGERLQALEEHRRALQGEVDATNRSLGLAEGQEQTAADRAARAAVAMDQAREELARARSELLARVAAEHRADLDTYVFVHKKGGQLKVANLPGRIEQAQRQLATLEERLSGSDGLRHPLLWQKYAFSRDAGSEQLIDTTGATLGEVSSKLQGQVDELQAALGEGRDDLLERIVLEDLVSTLRGEVFGLERTIADINQLVADLSFGSTRYRIRAHLKPEMRRPHKLLEETSSISPAKTAELKDYFAARLDELSSEDDALPPLLDYRKWFDFELELFRVGEDGVALSRERLRQGSGGEQAVPSYLLLFCLSLLLYQGIEASVRLLLLDEAFYGIDAGRRDELLRFCTRAGITLVVATPELDGISEALDRSTTLLVEKSPEGDVFLHDYRFARKTETLFERALPEADTLRIGVEAEAGA
ncbi:MAG: SbcC/MukB-like Walker B domain-containing protein [Deltaproteobacteria bacterium]|nr:SbcC/MukB-like Walker B domain-containing protein [Deltaproteobacteria bacterium]